MGSCLRKAPPKHTQQIDEMPPDSANPNIVSALHLQPVRINTLKYPRRMTSKSWLDDSSESGSESPAPSKSLNVDTHSNCVASPSGNSSTPSNNYNDQTSPTESGDHVFISPLGDNCHEMGDDLMEEGIDPFQRDTFVTVSKAATSAFRQQNRMTSNDDDSSQMNLRSAEYSIPEEEENTSRASFFDAPDFDQEQQESAQDNTFTPTRYENLPEYIPYITQEDNQDNISRQNSSKVSHVPSFMQQQHAGGDSDDEVEEDDEDDDHHQHPKIASLSPFGSRSQNSSFYQQTPPASNNTFPGVEDSPTKSVAFAAIKRQSSQQNEVGFQIQPPASASAVEPECYEDSAEYTAPRKSTLTRRRSQSHSTITEMFANNSPLNPASSPIPGSVNRSDMSNSSTDGNDLIIQPETRQRAGSAPESIDNEAIIFAGAAGQNVDRSFTTDLAKDQGALLSLKKSSEISEHDEEKRRHFAHLGRVAVVTNSGQRPSLLAQRGGRGSGSGSSRSQEFLKRASANS